MLLLLLSSPLLLLFLTKQQDHFFSHHHWKVPTEASSSSGSRWRLPFGHKASVITANTASKQTTGKYSTAWADLSAQSQTHFQFMKFTQATQPFFEITIWRNLTTSWLITEGVYGLPSLKASTLRQHDTLWEAWKGLFTWWPEHVLSSCRQRSWESWGRQDIYELTGTQVLQRAEAPTDTFVIYELRRALASKKQKTAVRWICTSHIRFKTHLLHPKYWKANLHLQCLQEPSDSGSFLKGKK